MSILLTRMTIDEAAVSIVRKSIIFRDLTERWSGVNALLQETRGGERRPRESVVLRIGAVGCFVANGGIPSWSDSGDYYGS